MTTRRKGQGADTGNAGHLAPQEWPDAEAQLSAPPLGLHEVIDNDSDWGTTDPTCSQVGHIVVGDESPYCVRCQEEFPELSTLDGAVRAEPHAAYYRPALDGAGLEDSASTPTGRTYVELTDADIEDYEAELRGIQRVRDRI